MRTLFNKDKGAGSPSKKPESHEPDFRSRLEALTMTVRGFAHNINNLMSAILGNSGLVRNWIDDSHPASPALKSIEQAAERAGDLSRKLQAFAHEGKRIVRPVSLNPMVYNVMLEEEQRLAPSVRFERYNDPDLWRVKANEAEIGQVILELAKNAIESIREKGLITLRTRNYTLEPDDDPPMDKMAPGNYVQLTVEDNGEGIAASDLPQVYGPGFTRKGNRAGMGLTMVRAIVRNHGGHIMLNSTKGVGTEANVYFPAFAEAERPLGIRGEEMPRGTETILVVDDERMMLDLTKETLERLGYQTILAHNGKEGVEIARKHSGPIAACLLDMAMPVMGGAEAYPLLKQARPEMKVIICTGFEQKLVTDSMLDAGAQAFLLKPFRPSTLAQEIRKAIDEDAA